MKKQGTVMQQFGESTHDPEREEDQKGANKASPILKLKQEDAVSIASDSQHPDQQTILDSSHPCGEFTQQQYLLMQEEIEGQAQKKQDQYDDLLGLRFQDNNQRNDEAEDEQSDEHSSQLESLLDTDNLKRRKDQFKDLEQCVDKVLINCSSDKDNIKLAKFTGKFLSKQFIKVLPFITAMGMRRRVLKAANLNLQDLTCNQDLTPQVNSMIESLRQFDSKYQGALKESRDKYDQSNKARKERQKLKEKDRKRFNDCIERIRDSKYEDMVKNKKEFYARVTQDLSQTVFTNNPTTEMISNSQEELKIDRLKKRIEKQERKFDEKLNSLKKKFTELLYEQAAQLPTTNDTWSDLTSENEQVTQNKIITKQEEPNLNENIEKQQTEKMMRPLADVIKEIQAKKTPAKAVKNSNKNKEKASAKKYTMPVSGEEDRDDGLSDSSEKQKQGNDGKSASENVTPVKGKSTERLTQFPNEQVRLDLDPTCSLKVPYRVQFIQLLNHKKLLVQDAGTSQVYVYSISNGKLYLEKTLHECSHQINAVLTTQEFLFISTKTTLFKYKLKGLTLKRQKQMYDEILALEYLGTNEIDCSGRKGISFKLRYTTFLTFEKKQLAFEVFQSMKHTNSSEICLEDDSMLLIASLGQHRSLEYQQKEKQFIIASSVQAQVVDEQLSAIQSRSESDKVSNKPTKGKDKKSSDNVEPNEDNKSNSVEEVVDEKELDETRTQKVYLINMPYSENKAIKAHPGMNKKENHVMFSQSINDEYCVSRVKIQTLGDLEKQQQSESGVATKTDPIIPTKVQIQKIKPGVQTLSVYPYASAFNSFCLGSKCISVAGVKQILPQTSHNNQSTTPSKASAQKNKVAQAGGGTTTTTQSTSQSSLIFVRQFQSSFFDI